MPVTCQLRIGKDVPGIDPRTTGGTLNGKSQRLLTGVLPKSFSERKCRAGILPAQSEEKSLPFFTRNSVYFDALAVESPRRTGWKPALLFGRHALTSSPTINYRWQGGEGRRDMRAVGLARM